VLAGVCAVQAAGTVRFVAGAITPVHHTLIVQSQCPMEPSLIVLPELLGPLGCIVAWAHMSLSCHGPNLLPTGGSWNFVPQIAWVDCQFLLNRLLNRLIHEISTLSALSFFYIFLMLPGSYYHLSYQGTVGDQVLSHPRYPVNTNFCIQHILPAFSCSWP